MGNHIIILWDLPFIHTYFLVHYTNYYSYIISVVSEGALNT